MHYLNDFGQSGVDETKILRLFWPSSERMLLPLDCKQPKWTKMLRDGETTCCFAVALDHCLVYRGEVSRLCTNTTRLEPSRACASNGPLFSTIISLHGSETVGRSVRVLRTKLGCLNLVGEYQDGYAQLAEFWKPNILDRTNEALDSFWSEDLTPITHAELLDLEKDTGDSLDVCIMDQ